jgi:soluble lytic murein transglycosylase
LRAEKLIAIGLLKRARTELNRLERIRGNPAFLFYMAQLFHRAGDFQRSIRLSWKIVKVKNLSTVPEDISQALFPKAHWDLVRQVADANELDPFFILSLMRQESAFQAEVISTSNAIGLMQLLPGTASLVARSMKQKAPEVDELKEPDTNIPLGTRYIANLLTRFGQNKVHALAAYNAGPRKVKNWLKIRSQLSPLEFIESIPYNETRNYVKKILRNYAIYHALYSDSPEDALKHLLTNPAP